MTPTKPTIKNPYGIFANHLLGCELEALTGQLERMGLLSEKEEQMLRSIAARIK